MLRAESFGHSQDEVTWLYSNQESLTQISQEQGFVDWVLTMLGRLVDADEYLSGHASGLRTFVRLDVGVYRNASTGDFQYFINEMSKGINVGLYMQWVNDLDQHFFFSELSHTLHFLATQFQLENSPAQNKN